MKLVEVMASVDRVAKNGTNASQGYRYAMAADVYDAVRAELARRFVLPCPNPTKWEFSERKTNSGGTLTMCTVQGTLDFVDAETGETIGRPMFGQGSDSLDKASYKAMTGAMKSALVGQFLIPTGDDPENEGKPIGPPPPPAGLASIKSKMPPAAPPSSPHIPTEPPSHDRNFIIRFSNKQQQKLHELSEKSLAWFRGALTESIADPDKSQWADNNSRMLGLVVSEMRFRGLPID